MLMLKPEKDLSLSNKIAFFETASCFEGLDSEAALEIARLSFTLAYTKGETIFSPRDPICHFFMVKTGLVKVSIYSTSGFKLTYLLAEHGEPLNLVSPFTCNLRSTAAEALSEVLLICVRQKDFLPFVVQHPNLMINAISILGKAVDSANLRIIDLIEKKVEDRLARVLFTLYNKFGSPLNFTSFELAALTGTTTESILRAMGSLREKGLIRSERRQTHILDPSALIPQENETLWL
jgi:CRP/FNR family transcriptional regulator, nitrogen oxide reductase regulator